MRKFLVFALIGGVLYLITILASKEIYKCEEARRTGDLVDVLKDDRRSY